MAPARAQAPVRQMQARGIAVPPQLLAIANAGREVADTLAPNAPGGLPVRVMLPGRPDAVSVTQIFCRREQPEHDNGKTTRTLTAWVDPVRLSNPGDPDPLLVPHTLFKLQQAQIEPSIAENGQTVQLSVKMVTPG